MIAASRRLVIMHVRHGNRMVVQRGEEEGGAAVRGGERMDASPETYGVGHWIVGSAV